MERLTRKIDSFLIEWKQNKDRLALIVKGARQIGKTMAIEHFAAQHYKSDFSISEYGQRAPQVSKRPSINTLEL